MTRKGLIYPFLILMDLLGKRTSLEFLVKPSSILKIFELIPFLIISGSFMF